MKEKKKILIVDDEPDVLTTLEKRLTTYWFDVLKASSGKEAIAIAKEQRPDLILLDVVMPGMDGGQTAFILQHDPVTKNIPIIFLTCLLKKEESSETIAGKFFIAKPYDPQELLKEINKLV